MPLTRLRKKFTLKRPVAKTGDPPRPWPVDPELARRNVRLGWLLFGVFVLLFAGCVGVALLYLHFQ